MEFLNTIEEISMDKFMQEVIRFKMEGWHVIQICAVRVDGGYELSYSFGRDYDMRTLRLKVAEDETVPSITQVFHTAYLQENEAAELFGVKIEHMDPDYGDRLYRIDETAPFKKKE